MLGIDRVLHDESGTIDNPYDIGDNVWVKPAENRCHTKFKLGTVTGVISNHSRHIRDLRSAVPPEVPPNRTQTFSDNEVLPLLPVWHGAEEESSSSDEVDRPLPRRGSRERRPPDRYQP